MKAEVSSGLDTSILDAVIQSGSVDARRQLAVELAGLTANPESPDRDRQAVVPAILKLATDPVLDVRHALAEALSAAEKVHPDIVFTIVADEDEIALPFIALARGLDSSMEVAIGKVGDLARQVQVALRGDVSPDAVNFIAARCGLPVCAALFDNPGAQLKDKHFRILYSRFNHAPQIVERLLAREDLPLDIRIQQARRASNRIHQLVAERGWVPSNDAAEIVANAEETAVLDILAAAAPYELQRTIRFLTTKSMLTPSIIMRAACLGEMQIVEQALAHLCDMSVSRAAQLVYDGGPVNLRALYKKAGLPSSCFWLMRAAIDIEKEVRHQGHTLEPGDFGSRLIEAVMTRYEGMSMTERAKQLDVVSRFAEDEVRVTASRLKTELLHAA